MENIHQEDDNREINVSNWLELYDFLNKTKNIINILNMNSENYMILEKINELTSILDELIRKNCIHHLVYDYIDINIDQHTKICYCSKCMFTF